MIIPYILLLNVCFNPLKVPAPYILPWQPPGGQIYTREKGCYNRKRTNQKFLPGIERGLCGRHSHMP